MNGVVTPEVSDVRDPVHRSLVAQLAADDAALCNADIALRQAQADFEVTARKFAVQRDVTTRRVGFDPYSKGRRIVLRDGYGNDEVIEFTSRGHFRFIYMDVGDAAMIVLSEAEAPLTLDG